MKEMPRLAAVLALGRIAHETFVVASGARRSQFAFGHGRAHALGALTLFDSYHCSRYNTNTGVLTPQMFRDVFAQARKAIDARETPKRRSFTPTQPGNDLLGVLVRRKHRIEHFDDRCRRR